MTAVNGWLASMESSSRGQLSRVAGVAGGDGDLGAQAVGQTLLQIAGARERRDLCERPATDA